MLFWKSQQAFENHKEQCTYKQILDMHLAIMSHVQSSLDVWCLSSLLDLACLMCTCNMHLKYDQLLIFLTSKRQDPCINISLQE